MKKEKKKELPKANYGDATPEDVARALLRYRPKKEPEYFDEETNTPEKEPEYFDEE